MRMLVVEATNRTVPNTSTRFSCSLNPAVLVCCNLRNRVTMIYPMPIIGMLIQKIQRHVTMFQSVLSIGDKSTSEYRAVRKRRQ